MSEAKLKNLSSSKKFLSGGKLLAEGGFGCVFSPGINCDGTSMQNKKYFIFGAHIFSQNLIFNNLNTDGVIGILDNDSEKINQFLYGTKFKVYKPKFSPSSVPPAPISQLSPNYEI